MTLAKTLHRQIAVALLATGIVVVTLGTASAQRGTAPTGAVPSSCWLDEGYGRYSRCDNGNAGG